MRLWKDKHLSLSITRLGMEYLIIQLLVGLAALHTGNNLLYIIFCMMLGLFLVSGWVSMRAIQGIRFLSVGEGRFFARVRSAARLRFEEMRPRRSRGLQVSLELEGGHCESGFYPGHGALQIMVPVHIQLDRRGWAKVRSVELRTRHPFGFIEKGWRFPVDQALLVAPHPHSRHLGTTGLGQTPRIITRPGSSSPEGARPFRNGDPIGRVHWKRTAQRGTPWIRLIDDDEPHGLFLELNLLAWAPGHAFERELERLSGAILQARLRKQSVTLEVLSTHGRTTIEGPNACWEHLALAEPQLSSIHKSTLAESL